LAERLQLPMAAAAHLAGPVIRPLLQRGMNMSLHRFARLLPPGDPPEPTARAEQVQDCATRGIQPCLLSTTPRERR
jgi:hypothetical protein